MVIKPKAVPVVMRYAFMEINAPCRLQVGHPGVTSGEAMRVSKKKDGGPGEDRRLWTVSGWL